MWGDAVRVFGRWRESDEVGGGGGEVVVLVGCGRAGLYTLLGDYAPGYYAQ